MYYPDALEEIADRVIERKCGARGLRAIMEEFMTDIMYNLPDRTDIVESLKGILHMIVV